MASWRKQNINQMMKAEYKLGEKRQRARGKTTMPRQGVCWAAKDEWDDENQPYCRTVGKLGRAV